MIRLKPVQKAEVTYISSSWDSYNTWSFWIVSSSSCYIYVLLESFNDQLTEEVLKKTSIELCCIPVETQNQQKMKFETTQFHSEMSLKSSGKDQFSREKNFVPYI